MNHNVFVTKIKFNIIEFYFHNFLLISNHHTKNFTKKSVRNIFSVYPAQKHIYVKCYYVNTPLNGVKIENIYINYKYTI